MFRELKVRLVCVVRVELQLRALVKFLTQKLVCRYVAIASGVFTFGFTPFDKDLLVPVSSLLPSAVSPR
jgi:hypothetical protein